MSEFPLARAFPVVLAGPSGSGKTTVARALCDRLTAVRFSVSATTRTAREQEREGEDYQFLEREEFARLREAGGLLEWAEVHGEWYGTPRSNLDRARARDEHLLLDIDVQGARSVRETVDDLVSIFLLPPDGRTIVERLGKRRTETPEELRARLRTALDELSSAGEFDYVVVNDELEETVEAVAAIVRAEERRIERSEVRVQERVAELAQEIRRILKRGVTSR